MSFCIRLSKFIQIGPSSVELWWYIDFQDGGRWRNFISGCGLAESLSSEGQCLSATPPPTWGPAEKWGTKNFSGFAPESVPPPHFKFVSYVPAHGYKQELFSLCLTPVSIYAGLHSLECFELLSSVFQVHVMQLLPRWPTRVTTCGYPRNCV